MSGRSGRAAVRESRLCFRSFSATDVRRGEMFTTGTVDRKLGTEERAALDERVLQAYYARLNGIDENVRDLTKFFFGINTLVIGLVIQFVKDDVQQLILAIFGYSISVAIYLITYKYFLSWKLYARDMDELEDRLDYDISRRYGERLAQTPGKTVRVTLVRMRFNFLFVLFWLGVIAYFGYRLSSMYSIGLFWATAIPYVVVFFVVTAAPWVYFAGTLRPGVLWATVRALWAREV